MLKDYLFLFTKSLILLSEASAALIIGVGIISALFKYINVIIKNQPLLQEDIRIGFGRSLVLALEFELASDILKTAITPSIKTIGVLAAIVVLRTALNYFLQRELQMAKQTKIA